MYRGYRVVAFIPSGRERTMSLLTKYLQRDSNMIDQVQLWENTTVENDVQYIRNLESDFFKVIKYDNKKRPFNVNRVQTNTPYFYKNTVDPETIYIRFDDDIFYLEEDCIKNLLDFRIDNPDYFLVFADIWNNAIISFVHQNCIFDGDKHVQNIGNDAGVVREPYCMDAVGWGNALFAEYIHNILIGHIEAGTQKDLFFDRYDLDGYRFDWSFNKAVVDDPVRFSISCFAYFGRDFAKFGGIVNHPDDDEEQWLVGDKTRELGKESIIFNRDLVSRLNIKYNSLSPDEKFLAVGREYEEAHKIKGLNAIAGDALCSHFTFSPHQKPYILTTNILERYQRICNVKAQAKYYDLLDRSVCQKCGKDISKDRKYCSQKCFRESKKKK